MIFFVILDLFVFGKTLLELVYDLILSHFLLGHPQRRGLYKSACHSDDDDDDVCGYSLRLGMTGNLTLI